MQADLAASYPHLDITILGVNEAGYEATNSAITGGRDLPWLQDIDGNGNNVSDVWYDLWDITYRDVVVVDHSGEVTGVYNLTNNNLASAVSYDRLRNLLVTTAEAIPSVDIPGDANHDGIFNSADLVQVFQQGRYEDGFADNATWEQGDWDGDGDFTSSDMVAAFQAGNYTTAALTLPSTDRDSGLPVGDIASALHTDDLFGDDGLEARDDLFAKQSGQLLTPPEVLLLR